MQSNKEKTNSGFKRIVNGLSEDALYEFINLDKNDEFSEECEAELDKLLEQVEIFEGKDIADKLASRIFMTEEDEDF